MANRVLLGKGRTSGQTDYGLWVSKPGQNVLTCGDEQLSFDSRISDSRSGVTSLNGQTFIKHAEGKIQGNASTQRVVTFSALTNDDGNVSAPFVIFSAKTGSDAPHVGTYYASGIFVYGGIFEVHSGPFDVNGNTYSSGPKFGKITLINCPTTRHFHYALFKTTVQE